MSKVRKAEIDSDAQHRQAVAGLLAPITPAFVTEVLGDPVPPLPSDGQSPRAFAGNTDFMSRERVGVLAMLLAGEPRSNTWSGQRTLVQWAVRRAERRLTGTLRRFVRFEERFPVEARAHTATLFAGCHHAIKAAHAWALRTGTREECWSATRQLDAAFQICADVDRFVEPKALSILPRVVDAVATAESASGLARNRGRASDLGIDEYARQAVGLLFWLGRSRLRMHVVAGHREDLDDLVDLIERACVAH